eukprot:s100_g5.t1
MIYKTLVCRVKSKGPFEWNFLKLLSRLSASALHLCQDFLDHHGMPEPRSHCGGMQPLRDDRISGCHSRWRLCVQLRISVGNRQEQRLETAGNSQRFKELLRLSQTFQYQSNINLTNSLTSHLVHTAKILSGCCFYCRWKIKKPDVGAITLKSSKTGIKQEVRFHVYERKGTQDTQAVGQAKSVASRDSSSSRASQNQKKTVVSWQVDTQNASSRSLVSTGKVLLTTVGEAVARDTALRQNCSRLHFNEFQ